MAVKVFKAVWFLSLLTVLAVLLYVYASLPEELQVTEGEFPFTITRNGLFYTFLTLLAVLNMMIFVFSRINKGGGGFFASWIFGLVTFLHLFMIVVLQFFNLYNSQEKFDYSKIGFIIYGSLAVLVIWFVAGPVYYLFSRIFSKPTV